MTVYSEMAGKAAENLWRGFNQLLMLIVVLGVAVVGLSIALIYILAT